jgi:hypothetical protein
MKKKSTIFLIVFAIFVVIILTNSYIQAEKVISKKYDIVITKIELSPTNSMIFYNGNEEINLWGFDIRNYEDVRVGDIVYKEKESKYLYILRKDTITNKNIRILKVENYL